MSSHRFCCKNISQQLIKNKIVELVETTETYSAEETMAFAARQEEQFNLALTTKAGISAGQYRTLTNFFEQYSGSIEDMPDAYRAHMHRVLTAEQQQALANYHYEKKDAVSSRQATQGLSELQTLFNFDEDQKDRIYLALYDSADIFDDKAFLQTKLSALEEILTAQQLETYRQYLQLSSAAILQ